MEIADEITHRVLAYVAAVQRQGERLTSQQVDMYAWAPDHRVEVTSSIGTSLRWAAILTSRSEEETFTDYLERLGWVDISDRQVSITRTGTAVLRALNAPALDERDAPSLEIVLDPQDPFAYARALGELAQIEDALIVDAYFRLEQLIDVTELGNVSRVLTSRRSNAEMKTLASGLAALPAERPIEIRLGDNLHDRFFIPPAGPVRGLGTSLNGVGKRSTTLLTTIGHDAGDVIRKLFNDKWRDAEVLEPIVRQSPPARAAVESAQPAPPDEKAAPAKKPRAKRAGNKPSTD